MDSPFTSVVIDVSPMHPHSGGARTYARELLRCLPEAGIAATAITKRGDEPHDWPGAHSVLGLAPNNTLARLVWQQTTLVRALRTAGITTGVLHSPHYLMPEFTWPGSSFSNVVTIHDLTFFTRPQDHRREKVLLFRHAIRRAARTADHLICVSEHTARQLAMHLSARELRAPITIAPHGVDHQRFRPRTPALEETDAAALRRLGVRAPFVLFLGAVEPRKNVPALVRAWQHVRRVRTEVELVIAGKPWPGSELPDLEGVRKLGFVSDEDACSLLRGTAAFAYPSKDEGFGLPVIEALACGAPTVTTRSSVMAELAGEAALTCDVDDPDAFARRLLDAIDGDGPDLQARLHRARHFTWERSAQLHAEVYRGLV